jgi:DNA-binding transcriptional LysR family regulator
VPRRLPPRNALKAFEAAARHGSFTRTAQELCVTQGAVSQQVRGLDTQIGLRLFNRERQRLVIIRPFAHALAAPYAFWIVCPQWASELPKVAAFRAWALAEVARDRRRIDALVRAGKTAR